jgi:hypothetical protein
VNEHQRIAGLPVGKWDGATQPQHGRCALNDPVLAAVLCSLAGARTGDRVAVVGADPTVARALLAMTSTTELVDEDAAVAVAGAAFDVPIAVSRLAPGGRLVAVAADSAAAQRVAHASGLDLRHVERVGPRVAWSAVRPHAP